MKAFLIIIIIAIVGLWALSLITGTPSLLNSISPLLGAIAAALGLALKLWDKEPDESPAGKKRTRKRQGLRTEKEKKPFRMAASFRSGFLGGLIGGGAAGLLNGFLYYATAGKPALATAVFNWNDILFLVSYAVITGAVFGSFSQIFIHWLRHVTGINILGDIVGGVVGGGLSGLVMGILAGFIFGSRNQQATDPKVIFWCGIVSGVGIFAGVFLSERKRRRLKLIPSLGGLALAIIIVSAIGVYILVTGPFDVDYFKVEGPVMIKRAATFGGIVNSLWGLQLGLALGIPSLFNQGR
jgi:hypothetical protein